ncbi:hypothetical protein BGX34_007877 [Mortierella sp. NVP85]|nr:hypothetical protein BGX34_007877 [Mortierella sp. NVP85]
MRLITLLGACALIATISTTQAQDAVAPPSSAVVVSVAAAGTGDATQYAVAPVSVPVADELESRVPIFNAYAVDAGDKDQQETREKGDKKGVTSKPKAEKEMKERKEARKEAKDAKMEDKEAMATITTITATMTRTRAASLSLLSQPVHRQEPRPRVLNPRTS